VNISALIQVYNPLCSADEVVPDLVGPVARALDEVGVFIVGGEEAF